MEQDYLAIQARVRQAQQQRSQDLGARIGAGLKKLLHAMQVSRPGRQDVLAQPSGSLIFQCLP
jgi:hypothetical protein